MSFSIDTTALFDYATQIISGLMPVVAIVAGFGLGASVLAFLMRSLKNIF
jgi:hypothetical protein